ncbi:uncharacterized protein LOC111623549 [Centruroides sculpturatus]|nr:uncharacterized protein LOC111623549 [Centruroides sculpturatus]
MAILHSCCCWKSVRRGSFASGIFTLGFYTVVLTAGAFHINTVLHSPVLFVFSLFMLIISGFCVISSVLLLVGLCADNRLMLLPWIVSISMTTVLDLVLSFYLISESQIDPLLMFLFALDFLICCLNIYCLLCVVSQYQEYLAGRGRGGLAANIQPIPIVRFQHSSEKEQQLSIKFDKQIHSVDHLAAPTFSISSKSTELSSLSFDPNEIERSEYEVSRLSPNHLQSENENQQTITSRNSLLLCPGYP